MMMLNQAASCYGNYGNNSSGTIKHEDLLMNLRVSRRGRKNMKISLEDSLEDPPKFRPVVKAFSTSPGQWTIIHQDPDRVAIADHIIELYPKPSAYGISRGYYSNFSKS